LPVFTKANTADPKDPLPVPQAIEQEYSKTGEVELLTKEDAFSRLSEWSRLVQGKLTVSWNPPATQIVGKDLYFEGVEIVSPFVIGGWQMEIDKATYLEDLPTNTQAIPGLVISGIDKKDNFLIQGEIYVQSN
jgi:hypothetical protein